MNKKLLPLLFALLARNRSAGGWITIVALAVIYLMIQPILSSKLGIPLPGLFGGSDQQPVIASTEPASSGDRVSASPKAMGDLVLQPKAKSTSSNNHTTASESNGRQPIAQATTTRSQVGSKSADSGTGDSSAKSQAPLGKLTEVAPKVFETTAGLRYGPGSVDRHRLLHVMQHAKDRPEKPVHGVFDGDEYKIRAVIDEAYLIADLRGPPQAKKTVEGDRTVWKVDLKRKVGYLGGQVGKRKNFPSLTGVQLVLEGVNVITAYPVDPRR